MCIFLHAFACIFLLLTGNGRVNCVQYGVFTQILRACNAAIPLAGTVDSSFLVPSLTPRLHKGFLTMLAIIVFIAITLLDHLFTSH